MTTERDIRNQIAYAAQQGKAEGRAEGEAKGMAEGMAKGRAEGRAEGEAKGKLETAAKLKALGVPAETIIQATGLTAEQVENL